MGDYLRRPDQLGLFHFPRIPSLRLDRLVKHADGQWHLVPTALGSALLKHIKSFRLKIAVGIVVDELDGEALLQCLHQMPGVRAIATQVEIDRGVQPDGLAFRQADFFVEQLHELAHGVIVGEVWGEVHGGGSGMLACVRLEGKFRGNRRPLEKEERSHSSLGTVC